MLIIGTGGLGKEIMGMLIDEGYSKTICFFDENSDAPDLLYDKFHVIKSYDELTKYFENHDKHFVTGIGQPRIREIVTERILKHGGILTNVISSKSTIFPFNEKPEGIIIQPGVGISHGTVFGRCCAIHIGSSIGHKTVIGNYVNVAPSATIIGPVEIGDYSYISAQSVIMPNLKIGKNVLVGVGAVVTRDLKDFETFPA